MGVIVTGPLATPANVVASLRVGGSLEANTTYYYRVMAWYVPDGFTYGIVGARHRESVASSEAFITTTLTDRTIKFDWDIVPGANYYSVMFTKVSGNYGTGWNLGHSKQIASSNVNTYTLIGAITSWTGQATFQYPDALPLGFDKEAPYITVEITGACDLQDIKDAVDLAGYGTSLHYKGFVFAGKIGVDCYSGSGVGSLECRNHVLMFFAGGIYNDNADLTIVLGTLDPHFGEPIDGASVYLPLEQSRQIEGYNILAYGASFHRSNYLFPAVGYHPFTHGGGGHIIHKRIGCEWKGASFQGIGFISSKDLSGVTTTDYDIDVRSAPLTLEDLDISRRYYGILSIHNPVALTMRTSKIKTSVGWYHIWMLSSLSPKFYNCFFYEAGIECDPIITWQYPATAPTMYFYYGFDLTVVDEVGSTLDGVKVEIRNVNGNEVAGSPFTTDGNGQINVDLLAFELDPVSTHVSTKTVRTPHTVTISKNGYVTSEIIYPMDQKRVEIEVLERYPAPTDHAITIDITEDAILGAVLEDAIVGNVED